MKKPNILMLSLVLCVQAHALVGEDNRTGQYQTENTQDQVAAQQAYQGRMGEVGTVQTDTEIERNERIRKNDRAESALSAGTQRSLDRGNLAKANEKLEAEQPGRQRPATNWAFGGLLVAVACASGLAFKDFVSKRIPDMPVLRKKKKKQIKSVL